MSSKCDANGNERICGHGQGECNESLHLRLLANDASSLSEVGKKKKKNGIDSQQNIQRNGQQVSGRESDHL